MKKRRLAILTISVIMFLGISATLIAQNMVTNPGFENWTGGVPDNWSLSGGDIVVEQEATLIHSGNYSAKITWTTTSTRHFEQVVPINPDTDYTLSAWIYDNDSDGRARLTLRWEEEGGLFLSNDYSDYTSDNTEWQNLTVSGTAPSDAAQARLRISVYDTDWDGDATIYADDVEFTGPGGTPIMTKAYSISISEVDVFYNQDMTSVNVADYTLTGTATITFSNALIDDDNHKLVHLTGASDNMVGDTTLDNIYDAENDTDFDFYAGITPIALTNPLNPDGHIVNGELATFQGIVSANDDYNNVWVSDDYGAYNGVLIYDYDFDALVAVGDEILFVAKRDEYNNLTELKDPILLSIISSGNEPYLPALISGSDIEQTIAANTNPAEQWEGQLVAIDNVLVASLVSKDDLYIGSDDSWVTTFVIGDNVDYQYANIGPILDDAIASGEPIDIKGVVDWNTYENYYRINPRFAEDLPVDDYPNPVCSSVLYNYPNPFSASTMISFSATDLHRLPQIKIYNIKGQLVKNFEFRPDIIGTNSEFTKVVWDGKDENGKQLPDGIYFYKLTGGEKSLTKKMILLR